MGQGSAGLWVLPPRTNVALALAPAPSVDAHAEGVDCLDGFGACVHRAQGVLRGCSAADGLHLRAGESGRGVEGEILLGYVRLLAWAGKSAISKSEIVRIFGTGDDPEKSELWN